MRQRKRACADTVAVDEAAARKAQAKLRSDLLAEHPAGGQSGGMAAFEQFAKDCCERKFRPLDARALETYKGIWLQWLMHLAGVPIHWREAKPDHVLSFLKSRRARSHRRSPDAGVSSATEGRYARVIQSVYKLALPEEERHLNPVQLVGTGVSMSENVETLRLHSGLRTALRTQFPSATDAASARDRAIVCLALLEGLSCADIMGLDLCDLMYRKADLQGMGGSTHRSISQDGWGPAFVATEGKRKRSKPLFIPKHPPIGLQVSGERKAQDRLLALSKESSKALASWLEYRFECNAATTTDSLILSLSRRTAMGGARASYAVLFKVCSAHIQRTLPGCGYLTEEEVQRLVHIGPNVLRNACLLEWLERGVDVDEVRRRAGLQETRSLTRLMSQAAEPEAA